MVVSEEIEQENFKYDKDSNRMIITLEDGTEIKVKTTTLREIIPVINEEDKIKELFMILHDIDKEVLTKSSFFIRKMVALEKGIEDARTSLEGAQTMIEVKKWTAIIKSFVDSKNALAEIRRTIGLIDKISRKPINIRLSALGHDPTEYLK